MKITDVKTTALFHKLDRPLMDSISIMNARSMVLVTIHTDSGTTGFGESACYGGPPIVTQTIIEKELRNYLIGKDPCDIELIWQKMYTGSYEHGRRGAVIQALSGVDIALWDIKGKLLGLPIYKILGSCRDKVPAYASVGFYAEGKDNEELISEVLGFVRRGFSAVKMKIGRLRLEDDVERVRAVREAVGDKIKLLVDANCAYTPCQAIRALHELNKYDIFFFEEPTTADNIDGYVKIASSSSIPIAAGENFYTRYEFKDLIARGAVDIVQPDPIWCGGLSEAKKISDVAGCWSIHSAPHAFSSALGLAASLQLLMSIPNGLILEFDGNPNIFREKLVTIPIDIDSDGDVRAPSEPGLGIAIDESIVKQYVGTGLEIHL
jgi:L-alanine-DL-glutamate epimerase-like enolase superfamily enzyme